MLCRSKGSHGNAFADTVPIRTISPAWSPPALKPCRCLTTRSGVGGCDFAARPSRSAAQQQVVWSPASNPAVVCLTQRPDFLPSIPHTRADRFAAARDGPEGSYCALPEHDLQILFLPGASPNAPLAALMPLDGDLLDRIDALARLARAWLERPPLRDTRMTVDQRRRFRLRLRAADGRMNGATYREIAIAIYGAARVESDPWKTSPLRDAVIAFVEAGMALIDGGYLKLLRHRRRA